MTTNVSNSSLPEGILKCEFSKFVILTFDYCSDQSVPIQHLHQYQDKMVIHARNDSALCRIFPSSLKGLASNWFYFLPPHSIYGLEYLTKLFLAQYSFYQELNRNNHHLLSIKIKPFDSLKAYIRYF